MSELTDRLAALSPEKRELLARRLSAQKAAQAPEPAQPAGPPLVALKRGAAEPLAPAQQRLWFLHQFEPDSPVYTIAIGFQISGPLDLSALERALDAVLERHEILRTTFHDLDGQPVQRIAPHRPFVLPLREVPGLHPDLLRAQLNAEANRPFDLQHGPLFRTLLFRRAPDDHLLLLALHHLIADGWSLGLLFRELAALYTAFAQGRPSPLAPLALQYADYARWQQDWFAGPDYARQAAFWKQQLAGAPPALILPTDRPRPAAPSYRGATRSFLLPAPLADGLRALSQREGATLFMTLLAAFSVLLARYSAQDDVLVGTPVANRQQREVEPLLGFFVNTLVLRTRLDGNPSFRALLAQVRQTALASFQHQQMPLDKLVEELQLARDLSYAPLVQVMFALQNAPLDALKLPGLELRPLEVEHGTAKFDLLLTAEELPEGLSLAWEYSTDLFEEATVERLQGRFAELLRGIVDRPDCPVGLLPLLPAEERRLVLEDWTATAAPFPLETAFPALFAAQVARTPEAVAVQAPDATLTYRELDERARHLAAHLLAGGAGPETLVAILADRGAGFLTAVLASFLAGAAYLPLDPHHPPARLRQVVAQSRPLLALVTPEHQPNLAAALDELEAAQRPRLALLPELQGASAPEVRWPEVRPEHLAYVIYTSGSTGAPKGAMVEQRGMVNHLYVKIRDLALTEADTVAQTASQCFDISVWQFLAALLAGGRVLVLPDEVTHDPAGLLEALERQGVSVAELVPAMLRSLLEQPEQPELKALRWMIPTGEALPPEVAGRWLAAYPHIPLLNAYGPTECSDDVTHAVLRTAPAGQGPVPIGRAVANMQLYILDRHIQPVPLGVTGELYVAGAGVGRGYYGRPDLTAERFVPNPFAERSNDTTIERLNDLDHDRSTARALERSSARLYRTGDLGRWQADGQIEFLGRIDQQVKVRGFRIELGEIEAVLGQHPEVGAAVVQALPDRGGDSRLVAYVVPRQEAGGPLSSAELRAHVKRHLPEYMVPSLVVVLETLPLTPNGKVDRRALPEPALDQNDQEESLVGPRTPTEQLLAGVWAELLGVTRVGAHSSFFDLGGHSLLATQINSRIRDVFEVALPLRALFEAPTLAALAQRIDAARREQAGGEAGPALVAVPRGEVEPLAPAQQRLWLLHQFDPDSPVYNIAGALQLDGPLDVAALERALDAIVERHEILRTTFHVADGQPVQRIAAHRPFALPLRDLSGAGDEQTQAVLRAEATQPFDLRRGPLLRTLLLRRGPDDHVLLLVLHHLIADGWSLGVLVRELGALYSAAQEGQPLALPALPVQYVDIAHWQRAWLASSARETQLAYWRRQLAGAPPLLALPTDFPRPPVQRFRGALLDFQLPAALRDALQELSRREGVTLFMALLAAFQVLLGRYSGQRDLCVGTPIANRTHAAAEGVIGMLVNTLVMRAKLDAGASFRSLLAQVREAALGAYAHQDLPFEQLVEALQPDRSLSAMPLVQVLFALQNAPMGVLELPALSARPISLDLGTARCDLSLILEETPEGLSGLVEYNTDLFERATVERLVGHYRELLASALETPDAQVDRLALLPAAERQQVLAGWNATEAPLPAECCAHELVAQHAALAPQATALVSPLGQLTYAQLDQQANQLAHHLRSLGVGLEVPVAICAERSALMVVALLAVLKAGGAYVPLDPSYPPERLAWMLQDSGAPVVLTEAALLAVLPAQDLTAPGAPTLVCLDRDWAEQIAPLPTSAPAVAVAPDHLAYIIYTSGSTGRPKGVQIAHRGLLNLIFWHLRDYRLGAADRTTHLAGTSFDASVWEIWPTLAAGAELHLPDEATRRSPAALQQWLIRQRITVCFLPTPLAEVLLALDWPPAGALRFLLTGGDALSQYPSERLPFALVNHYGPTESTVVASSGRVPSRAPEGVSPSIGRPIANTRIYLLDPQLQPVPVGVPGELYIASVGLARGYHNRPDLTAERFVPNPFRDEGRRTKDEFGATEGSLLNSQFSTLNSERLYRTGDLARWLPDGQIEFLGRIDQQVKIRGFRIELGEIEAALAQYPGLREHVVLVQEPEPGRRQLAAYIVPSDRAAFAAEDLRTFLRGRLPDYMVPAAIVALEELPLTPNGKIDRRALPQPERAPSGAAFVGSELEQQIAAIWRGVLGTEQIGANDNFFDLGGHSLLLVQVHDQLQRLLGRELSILDLFQHTTVSALARHLSPRPEQPAAQPQAKAARAGATDIAIVGMSGRVPGASDLRQFWENLTAGAESIAYFSDEELQAAGVPPELLANPRYVKAGMVLDGIELFDAAFFGLTPREAEVMDPQQRLFLECAWEALEHAGYDPERYQGQIGLYAGSGMGGYLWSNLYSNPDLINKVGRFQIVIGNNPDHLTTFASYKLNLRGPSVTVQTACSTSLVAVHHACQSLISGECDMALAGGVSIHVPHRTGYLYQEGEVLSPDGHCRAFDAGAQGTAAGSGVALVVLKPLASALADGDTIYAVIKGSAINNDGRQKVGYTAPSIEGQARVIGAALAAADVSPETVSYVEAHGTGTLLGDPIEVAALTQAFQAHTAQRGFCAIGSVKTNIGHLDTASGAIGLIKVALSLRHRTLPPSLNLVEPNPQIDFANSPFYVNAGLRPWEAAGGPLRAGVSSFGIGGTNAHAILEEAPPEQPAAPGRPWQVLTLSAKSAAALEAATDRLAAFCRQNPELPLADAAYTLQVGRAAFAHRRVVVCQSVEQAADALERRDSARVFTAVAGESERRVIFLFPGQGTQHIHMAADIYRAEPVFRAELDRCAELLRPHLGLDIRALLYPAPDEAEAARAQLSQTGVTQPALFAVEYALARLWMAWGLRPAALIGHSIGEYVAACLAGVFTLEDALMLVAARAQAMQQLPPGAMLTVALPEAELAPLLGDRLSVAAVNAPDLCVVAGPAEAVEALQQDLAARQVECRRLHTSHAFHSAMMEPAAELFARRAAQVRLQAPQIPYISNVTGTWITTEQATDPSYWARHLRLPVRFADGLGTLLRSGAAVLLEVGPGQTLSTFARSSPALTREHSILASLPHQRAQTSDLAHFLGTAGRLWLAGVALDWEAASAHEQRRRIPLPTYPFERQRYWIEPAGQARLALEQPGVGSAAAGAAEQPAPVYHPRPGLAHDYVAPRNTIERTIAEIWQDVLGLEQVGIHDNLFELGGHSLLASRLIIRLREAFNADLPLNSLFEAPTVAEFGQQVAELTGLPSLTLPGAALDLFAEARLDPAIMPLGPVVIPHQPQHVLLTGATGFLGAFLLYELLQEPSVTVHCLVRASDPARGAQRIRGHLTNYRLWDDRFAERIVAVPGDLAQPLLGLTDEQFQTLAHTVELIYHNGGMVNFVYPYAAHRATNVLGTQDVLRLACLGAVKPVHFVSTLAVFSSAHPPEVPIIREGDSIDPYGPGLVDGYPRSKWVAEKLVAEAGARGLPVSIYRPGEVTGHSRTGVWTEDFVYRLVTGCMELGAFPDIDSPLSMIPVDYVSKAIVQLSRQPESLGKVFHLINPHTMPVRSVAAELRALGCPLQVVPYEGWRASLAAAPENPLYPFLPTLPEVDYPVSEDMQQLPAPTFNFDHTNTLAGLAGSGISCPPLDGELLRVYFTEYINTHYLQPCPEDAASIVSDGGAADSATSQEDGEKHE